MSVLTTLRSRAASRRDKREADDEYRVATDDELVAWAAELRSQMDTSDEGGGVDDGDS